MPDEPISIEAPDHVTSPSTSSTRPQWLRRAVHIFALSGFAVAQPLFGLLGTEPEFWIARDASYLDVVVLLVGVLVVLPATALLIEWLLGLVNDMASWVFHLLVVGGLGALIAVNVLDTVTGGSMRGLFVLVLAVAIGCGIAALYARVKTVRDFVGILALGPLIFAVLLIVSLPPLGGTDAAAVDVGITADNPVVFVVLDEFQIAAIQTESGDIDASRYPNLARLAGMSTWYPNATTVHDNTLKAVPALLSGSYPSNDKLANAADYPVNLFTVLADTHLMVVNEGVTQLCPSTICDEVASTEPLAGHLTTLGTDSAIVYLHTVVPETLRYRLPPIGTRWEGFLRSDDVAVPTTETDGARGTIEADLDAQTGEERAVQFGAFLDSIDPALGPALYYEHVDLPHAPWSFLDNGKSYPYSDNIPGYSPQGIWGSDEWYVQQAYLRYVQNIAFTDMLVGRTLDRLDEQGMIDDVLLIFTSDHGENFVVNESRRAITDDTLAALGGIPMFVKYPGQTTGEVSEENAQTIDLLPTVAEALGGSLPGVDGRSLISGVPPDAKRLLTNGGSEFVISVQDYLDIAARHLSETVAKLPTGEGFSAMFDRAGALPQLNGTPVAQLAVSELNGSTSISMQPLVGDYDPTGPFDPVAIPVEVSVDGGNLPGYFAIAVNGTIKTVVSAHLVDGGVATIYAFVPPGSFAAGPNTVEVFGVVGTENDVSLVRFG